MAKAQPRTTTSATSNNPKLSKRRSFSAWLKRKVAAGGIRKISPEYKGRVFGVPLVVSIEYAQSKINYESENAVAYQQAGSIPTVVAKTGRYLKENALHTEGIFRLQGSCKRIATLQETFDQPTQMYGEHVDWTNYTVHDAATLLRRYLNQLPNPVITHEYYQPFRDVMNDHAYGSIEERVRAYQDLIQKLPTPHQHLLLYLLDMLNLFSRHVDDTRMDASNLAAVFCPGILSHPSHNTPVHYKISQRVIEFLIEFQALFTVQNAKDTNDDNDEGITVIAAAEGAETKVPPIDMDRVRRANSVRRRRGGDDDDNELIDSGTDVKTPYTAISAIKDIRKESIDDDDENVPEHSIPLPSPCPTTENVESSSSLNPPSSSAVNVVGGLAALVVVYMLYQYMTLGRMLQGGLVVSGIAACSSTFTNTTTNNKAGPPPSPPPHKLPVGNVVAAAAAEDMQAKDEEQEEQDTSADGQEQQSLEEEEDDRATEERMMQDESIMSEWGHLLNRSWKTDPSTPQLHSSYGNNNRPDYFSRADSSSSALSFSTSSRFAEQDISDDEDGDSDSQVDPDELDRIWREIEQLEQDRILAEKLQREEQEAERQRDLSTNPFLMSPIISPKNTDKETWKIATSTGPRPS